MFQSLARACLQLLDPRLRRVLWKGLAYTLALFVGLHLVLGYALFKLHPFETGWLNGLARLAGELGAFALTTLLFPGIATLVQSFLLEEVAAAIETTDYPGLPPPRPQGAAEIGWIALRFAALAVAINLLALPLYLALLVLLGAGAWLYLLVNGYLLGRSYFELVAVRRLEPARADALRRVNAGRVWLVGIALALISSLPLLNLAAPILATATMLHEFEALRRRAGLL